MEDDELDTIDQDYPQEEPAVYIDQLLDDWTVYLRSTMEPFNLVPSHVYGTGSMEELAEVIKHGETQATKIIPWLQDTINDNVNRVYLQALETFCFKYHNDRGAVMTAGDLGHDEPAFYNIFIRELPRFSVLNLEDLWRCNLA